MLRRVAVIFSLSDVALEAVVFRIFDSDGEMLKTVSRIMKIIASMVVPFSVIMPDKESLLFASMTYAGARNIARHLAAKSVVN